MKGFTILEILVALFISSFLLLLLNKSHFLVTRSLQRKVSTEVILLSEGLKNQLKHLSEKEYLYEGKKVKPFFIWDEKRLVFVTEWSSVGPIVVCYYRGEKGWQYAETPLTGHEIPEDYCKNRGTFPLEIDIKIYSENEEISEITPGQKGAFTLQVKSTGYSRKLRFNL